MYEKDKKTRITLRVTEDQMTFLREQTEVLGISPSDYLRMVINATMALAKAEKGKEGKSRENDSTAKHDQL